MGATAKKLSIRLEAVGGDKVRQEFKNIQNQGTTAFNRIIQVVQPANDNLKILDKTARGVNSVFKAAAGLAGAYLGLSGLKSVFGSIMATNREFEQLSGSLKTVTGSTEAAQKAFAMIEKFALDTPYQLDEIVEAFIRLQALGLDPSQEALNSYGNTASAFGKNILEFAQAVAAATVGEFERLKTFGIKAMAEGEKVKFVFQGVTTEVNKNAKEIEGYLRSLGDINFAGAMNEQMKTMNGVLSNIEDNFAKIARDIGSAGLNDAIKEVLTQFNVMVDGADSVANVLGKSLATAVKLLGTAFFTAAEYAEFFLTLLTARFGSKVLMTGIGFLTASVNHLKTSLAGVSIATQTASLGITMMSQVSKLAATKMIAISTAVKVATVAMKAFQLTLSLIGGPAGLLILAGTALYKLVVSQDAAKKAAQDHAETLKRLQDELRGTAKESENLVKIQSRNEQLAEWGLKLKTAEENIKNLEDELKNTGGLPLMTRLTPNALLQEYEIYAKDWADILKQSKTDLSEYEREIWKIAAEYPDFQPQAQEISDKIMLLRAAREDALTARKELSYIDNPDLRPKPVQKIEAPIVEASQIKESDYKKNIEDIKQKMFELKEPYEQAITKANEWRENALKNLDKSAADYDNYKNQVTQVYDDMLKKAADTALQSSTYWKDGLKRGLISVYDEATDMAKQTESLVKNSFNKMTNTITEFVTTGKFQFSDFVNTVVEEMVRMAVQYSVVKPLMGGLMGYFGIPMAHTGGILGEDKLTGKPVDPTVFQNAPRFHSGGLVGNEIPIIAKRGEGVFTPAQMKAIGTELNEKQPVSVQVNVINRAPGTKAQATSSKDTNGNVSLNIIVEQIESAIGKNITKGEGLSPILEQRYGLNPAFGSYR